MSHRLLQYHAGAFDCQAVWLAQWLSAYVFLAFQLRRHFAGPAFSAFVSTGWLADRLALVHMLCLWPLLLKPILRPLVHMLCLWPSQLKPIFRRLAGWLSGCLTVFP